MTKKQLLTEWKRLAFEMFENKPKANKPLPLNIVERRELLLFAQVHLAEISWAIKCKNIAAEIYHTAMYSSIISKYYAYDN
jgi:hypothetical protein